MRFIVMGAGDVGTTLAAQLVGDQQDVVLIDSDETKLANSSATQLDLHLLQGNGCSPDVLTQAGLHTADYFIAVANEDEANIASCLVAKLLNPEAKRIARIRDINLIHKDIEAEHIAEYFDLIINPEQAAAEHLLRMFKLAGAREVLDFCDGRLQVVAIDVQHTSPYLGKKLAQLAAFKERLSMLIIAIIRDGELLIPRGSDTLRADDTVYCIVPPDKVGVLFEMLGMQFQPAKSAMVWGSGSLARILVHGLETQGTHTKLIVSETDPTTELLDEFNDTLVLVGDGKDKDLLLEENIQDIDAFIAVTPDEEDNILASLLAKKLGARTSMALVNKATYLPLVHAIGVDVVVSSRAAAAGAIFSHIHSDTIISDFSFRHLGAGFIEVPITEDMPIAGQKISKMKVPHGIIFAAISRGEEIIIPGGTDSMEIGDEVVMFITRGAHTKVEKLFARKLEFFV